MLRGSPCDLKLSLFVVVDAAVACDDLAMPGWTVSLVEDVDGTVSPNLAGR